MYDNATNGVFVLDRAFQRSYDLKLGTEAQVLILATDRNMSMVEAIQMVSRGCRSQGQGKGILYLKGDPFAKKDAWEQLQVKDRSLRDPGGLNLRVLFQNAQVISQKELDKIVVGYSGDFWKCQQYIFES